MTILTISDEEKMNANSKNWSTLSTASQVTEISIGNTGNQKPLVLLIFSMGVLVHVFPLLIMCKLEPADNAKMVNTATCISLCKNYVQVLSQSLSDHHLLDLEVLMFTPPCARHCERSQILSFHP